VIANDEKLWKMINSMISNDDRVEIYPRTEAEFKSFNSMVMCSLNPLINESIVKKSHDSLKTLLQREVFDETLLIITNTLFERRIYGNHKIKIGAFDFLQQFIEAKFQLPVLLLAKEEEINHIPFLKTGDKITTKEKVNRDLFNLFYS
jgi:hypothetical protein